MARHSRAVFQVSHVAMPLVTNIAAGEDTPLWHDPVPLQDVASEKPWHRLAIMLAAQGCTVTEIASRLERSVSWVSLLLRQPWARERLAAEINAQGRDELETLLKTNGPEAFRRIVYLSEEAENEAVKLAANRDIVDRLLGKPVAREEVRHKVTMVPASPAELELEIKKLEEDERRLLGAVVADGRRPDVSHGELPAQGDSGQAGRRPDVSHGARPIEQGERGDQAQPSAGAPGSERPMAQPSGCAVVTKRPVNQTEAERQ
jgi:hypothetical protein